MSIFERIKKRLWGDDAPAQKPVVQASANTTQASAGVGAPSVTPQAPAAPQTQAAAPASQTTAAAPAKPVDVAAIMDAAVAKNGQKLDWRHSIVDMMKALDMDSSLGERKELAAELGYTGDTGDSATMNIWLHKALMKKLADNGGKVPADLID